MLTEYEHDFSTEIVIIADPLDCVVIFLGTGANAMNSDDSSFGRRHPHSGDGVDKTPSPTELEAATMKKQT